MKTGSSVTEKRVGMDIADVREDIDEGTVSLRWMPTEEMPADGLTKWLVEQRALWKMAMEGKVRLDYTWEKKKKKGSSSEAAGE